MYKVRAAYRFVDSVFSVRVVLKLYQISAFYNVTRILMIQ